jgi:hypothetical protein
MHPVSAYLVTFGAALFSAIWALTFWRFYTHIDDPKDTDRSHEPRKAA